MSKPRTKHGTGGLGEKPGDTLKGASPSGNGINLPQPNNIMEDEMTTRRFVTAEELSAMTGGFLDMVHKPSYCLAVGMEPNGIYPACPNGAYVLDTYQGICLCPKHAKEAGYTGSP